MKKFTKVISKAVLTAAAVLAFYAHAGDSTPPASSIIKYDAVGNFPAIYWTPGSNFENNGTISGNYTAVEINNVLGKYYNNFDSTITGVYQYGLYAKSNSNMSLLSIENWGHIYSTYATGLNMVGINGQLNNWYDSSVFGNQNGVMIDTEAGSNSLIYGFTIHNEGNISSNDIGIYVLNGNQSVNIDNYFTGIISGKNNAILANASITINNENTILSQDKAAIYLKQGGYIINNGMIMSLATTLDAGRSIRSGGNLTLEGNGSYQGDIEFTGNTEALSILSLKNGNDYKNTRLTNWAYIMADGGKHYFNVVNDAQNSNYPRTEIHAYNNAYINTGAGGWGDANITLVDNSLLNPYRNDHDTSSFYWDRPALKLDTNPAVVIYDRKEFERLTVHDLTIEDESGLVMEVRYSEPNYTPSDSINDEDDRVGYWDDLHEGVESIYNPDGSYAGQGYRTRLKKVSGEVGDLFLYQRVSYDTINVTGTATIGTGAKLHLLEKTKWMEDDGYIPEFVEKPLDHLEINLFDGNIKLSQFEWDIDFYSDYYGIESVDDVNGIIHLTRDAYHSVFSGTKGQVDWWLKQASLGFPSTNPAAAVQTTSFGVGVSTTRIEQDAAAEAAQAAYDTTNEPTTKRSAITVSSNDDDNEADKNNDSYVGYGKGNDDDNEDEDDTPAPAPKPPIVASTEVLPYQTAKNYNIKITDLGASLELKAAISSFTEWADVDTFLDQLNKLEYASLMTSNINAINNRVENIYTQLNNDYYRDSNGVSIWFDTYMFDNSLQGHSNHSIDGSGFEVTAGFDKQFFDKLTVGLSFNHTDYSSDVNKHDVTTVIDSDGYGLTAFAEYESGKLTQVALLGYNQIKNSDVVADFDSSEMFAAYRAEYVMIPGITAIAGLRYATVKYDEIVLDADNHIDSITHDSLESELGVKLSKQFNKLKLNVTGAWMHEMLDTDSTVKVYSTFGDFNQKGITRDTDSFRMSIAGNYQLTDKMSVGVEVAREFSANAENSSIAAKFRIAF